MTWQSELTAIRAILMELYSDEQSAGRVVDDAGIPRGQIQFSTASLQNWHAILQAAQRHEKVLDVVAVALREFPNRDDLRAAAQAYSATLPGRRVPVNPPGLNLAVLRTLIAEALSSEELTELCFDHYPAVYEDFAAGMTNSQKITMLLEHCKRNGKLEELAAHVKRENIYQYQRFESQLWQP
jgi:hypothetical protein